MNTRQLSLLFAVFATYVTTDAFAFDVTPASFTSSEGTQRTLQITVEPADWVNVGFDTECNSRYQFQIDLVTSGNATWSNDQVSGDLNLDLNNNPFSLTNQITFCTTPLGENSPEQLVNLDYSINLHDDEIRREGVEQATLNFNGACNDPTTQATRLCPASVNINIVDETPVQVVSISASNGAEPSANGTFTFTLSEPAPEGGLTVNYRVSGASSATASIDYEALGSSIRIPAAGLSVDIPVVVIDDEFAELAESVIVEIQGSETYDLGSPVTATVSIVDNDVAGVQISGDPLTVAEDGSSDQFSVVLTSQPLADVNISVSSGNTTEATVDIATLVFTAFNWSSEQTVTVTGVDDDLDDGDTDLNIMLTIASNDISYASVAPVEVAVTNHDNDDPAAAVFSQENYPFAEDTGAAEIIIERVGGIGETVSVTFSTDDGASGTTATAGEDYTSVSEVLVWEPNDESSRTVEIPIMNDSFSEGDETVVLKLDVNDSDLPAAFSELVIQNDFIEDVADAIDLDNLPPNQRSISTVILKACPTGQGQGGFQELCNDLIGEALEGGSVGVPLKQITPDQSAAARAPAAETVTVQNINVNGRMAALRAGATGFSASRFSFNLAGSI